MTEYSELIGPSLDQEIRDLFVRFPFTNHDPNRLSGGFYRYLLVNRRHHSSNNHITFGGLRGSNCGLSAFEPKQQD